MAKKTKAVTAQEIVDETIRKEQELLNLDTKEIAKEIKNKKGIFNWDVKISDEVPFFDANLSYELTGYRPITKDQGLDFNPDWFTEAKRNKQRTGHYCESPKNGKEYRKFWNQEYKRCRDGMTVNGYTITGDNYFFLNYYQLMNIDKTEKAGGGRLMSFSTFFVKQYEYFHYIELCKRLRLNAVGLKARGVNNPALLQSNL